ncbi:hypothetical protein LUZ62_035808 [Rhynchospora pubera]|uniref:DUF632 domain-containing protein n=1 Tax=Rhynchospora pubera TaxID=906938 RepID=A0AAV8F301_9POAL|nr:hypothetical protein LUZ62_035808 [Rhynchospora pubera]
MGCAASKVDNEDTVRRCKERRRLMKEAVHSRHLLASAHADYLRSMRLAAASLSRFAAGEPFLSISDSTPPVLLLAHTHQTNATASVSSSLPPPTPQPPPPPPPAPHYSPPPSSTTTSTLKVPHILSRSTSSSRKHHNSNPNPNPNLPPRAFKLPHILSDSSPAPSTRKRGDVNYANRANLASTPSMSSSAWDWENFYPPSPPDSDYFDRRKAEIEAANQQQQQQQQQQQYQHHLIEEDEFADDDEVEEEEEEEDGEGEFEDDYDDQHKPQEDNDEMTCREWDERYTSTSSSSTRSRSDGYDDMRSRSEAYGYGYGYGYGVQPAPEMGRSVPTSEIVPPSSALTIGPGAAVHHRTLAEIAASIEEYFIKAAEAGSAVSELLETGRAQLDRSFSQLKKTVYHSNSVLSALSSTWSSKPPLAVKYQLDTDALQESGGSTSHGSTLERLLAWEKKLYEEVKARETVKIEHEKKLSTLQSQEYRGKDDAKLDKTKATIKRLQSLIIVTSQAVTTTSSAILTVRDNELAPQLVELCYALLKMWRSMHQFHEIQNNIVQQVRGLVNRAAGESTSDLQRMATRDLEASVASWHSAFGRLIKYQRDYIRSLYSWLKLTLFQVTTDDPKKDHSTPISLELTAFCDEWKQALDRLPDAVASEAIKSFMNVIHVIYTKQADELKVKKRADNLSKELEKKAKALRGIEKKYYQSYSMVGLPLPGSGREVNGQVFDTRDPLAEKKSELALVRRRVEDEMTRHGKAIEVTRSMTLNNIQTGLPGVFQAMTGFSGLFVEALETVCRRAGSVH